MNISRVSQTAPVCRLLRNKLPGMPKKVLSTSASLGNKKAWDIPERDLVLRRSEKGNVVLDVAKVKRDPFLKGLFQDKYDKEMLAFPEVLNKEQVDDLEEKLISLGYRNGKHNIVTVQLFGNWEYCQIKHVFNYHFSCRNAR